MARLKKINAIKFILWIFLLLESFTTGIFVVCSKYINRYLKPLRNVTMIDPAQFGLDYSQVNFPSRDGLVLRGWWLETHPSQPVVILLHGIGANRAEPPARVYGIARELISHGYNILTFDFRAHGESEGDHVSAGYYEKNDLLGAIDFIRSKGISAKIGVLGFSMGAAISLLAAAESKEIAAVVADSSFIDVVSLIKGKFFPWRLLSGIIIPALAWMTRMIYRFDLNKVKPLEAIKSIKVPVFIIHGGHDLTIPVEHAYKLRSACKNRHDLLWIVPEASHTEAFFIRTEEYLKRVVGFFDEALTINGYYDPKIKSQD